jgi:hypothetical protein
MRTHSICRQLKVYLEDRDTVGATPLHVAVLCGSLDVARYLIETYMDWWGLVCLSSHYGCGCTRHGPELVQAGYAGTKKEGISLYDVSLGLHHATSQHSLVFFASLRQSSPVSVSFED